MKIVCISDTHNRHREVVIPECDLLIHSGDATMQGTDKETHAFLAWYQELDVPVKVFVPGNHDFFFQRNDPDQIRLAYPGVRLLIDGSMIYKGYLIYGTPWVPNLSRWAYCMRDMVDGPAIWAKIPTETNILVTHGPEFSVRDHCPNPVGSKSLTARINDLPNLKLHCYGHIHEEWGVTNLGGYKSVNASFLDERYRNTRDPIEVEL